MYLGSETELTEEPSWRGGLREHNQGWRPAAVLASVGLCVECSSAAAAHAAMTSDWWAVGAEVSEVEALRKER